MTILELNTKTCMQHLLLKPTFHRFCLIEGEVVTFSRFHIDGRICKDFFDEDPGREYAYWREVQQHFLAVIRGKRTPLSFKLILSLPPEDFPAFINSSGLRVRPEDIQGLYLNLRYDSRDLRCVTGTSMKTFTMDRTTENAWDAYVKKFFIDFICLSCIIS